MPASSCHSSATTCGSLVLRQWGSLLLGERTWVVGPVFSHVNVETLTSLFSVPARILATAGTDFDLRTLRAVRVSLAKAISPKPTWITNTLPQPHHGHSHS